MGDIWETELRHPRIEIAKRNVGMLDANGRKGFSWRQMTKSRDGGIRLKDVRTLAKVPTNLEYGSVHRWVVGEG